MHTDKVRKSIEEQFRNQQLELQAIAFCMRKQPICSALLQKEWFAAEPLQKILTTIQLSKVVMSKAAVIQQLRNRHAITTDQVKVYEVYLNDIGKATIDHFTEKSLHLVAEQLLTLSESRRCLQGLRSIVGNLKHFDLAKAKDTFRDLGRPVDLANRDRSGEYLQDFEWREQQVATRRMAGGDEQQKTAGVMTGIARFDKLSAGLMVGEFGVIAGKTAVGKTAMLVAFAVQAWLNGENVLLATGEMPKLDIQLRIDSYLTGISAMKFRTGEMSEEQMHKWHAWIDKLRALQDCYLEVVAFPRNFSAETIEAEALRVQEKHKKPIRLLCIDYLNIMDSVAGFGSNKDWKNQADVVWDVKELTADLNGGISTWTCNQIIDDAYEKDKLIMTDLKYARAIGDAAPVVIGLVQTAADELDGTLQCQVLKMRNTPPLAKPILLHPDLDTMRIHVEATRKRDLLLLEDDAAILRERQAAKKQQSYKKGKKSL